MKRVVVAGVAVAFLLAGCATASKDVPAKFVSPLLYHSYDCTQIAFEGQRLQGRFVELGGRLDQAAANDKAIVGVGVLLFWPALFAVGGTKQQEAHLAQVKGEYEALQQAAVAKKCNVMPPAGATPGV